MSATYSHPTPATTPRTYEASTPQTHGRWRKRLGIGGLLVAGAATAIMATGTASFAQDANRDGGTVIDQDPPGPGPEAPAPGIDPAPPPEAPAPDAGAAAATAIAPLNTYGDYPWMFPSDSPESYM